MSQLYGFVTDELRSEDIFDDDGDWVTSRMAHVIVPFIVDCPKCDGKGDQGWRCDVADCSADHSCIHCEATGKVRNPALVDHIDVVMHALGFVEIETDDGELIWVKESTP